MNILVRIERDDRVPVGMFEVGGVRIIGTPNDAELGRELRTVQVRVNGNTEADRLRSIVENTEGLELAF